VHWLVGPAWNRQKLQPEAVEEVKLELYLSGSKEIKGVMLSARVVPLPEEQDVADLNFLDQRHGRDAQLCYQKARTILQAGKLSAVSGNAGFETVTAQLDKKRFSFRSRMVRESAKRVIAHVCFSFLGIGLTDWLAEKIYPPESQSTVLRSCELT